MKLMMFGLSHQQTPVEIRERFALGAGEVTPFLREWIESFGDYELVPISTCNRMELYIASENGSLPGVEDIYRFLATYKQINADTPFFLEGRKHFVCLQEEEAVTHLFRVASSLESMVLGESQILAQVKAAYQEAAQEGATGTVTHLLFQSALGTAKRVTAGTLLHQHRVSIPSVAVIDFAMSIFEKLSDKKTVVLGAGEMAGETLRYLVDLGCSAITVINRSRDRAESLAAEFSASICDWDNRSEALIDADIVIAATAAGEFVITEELGRSLVKERAGRSLFMLDLSVPRNIDPRCSLLPNVYLYSIDDLSHACSRNQKLRDHEIPKAAKIIQTEVNRFIQEIQKRRSSDIIRQLRQTWNAIKEAEVERLINKSPELDDKTIQEIRYTFDRIVNKMLHPPMESLKDESVEPTAGRYLETIRRLFRL